MKTEQWNLLKLLNEEPEGKLKVKGEGESNYGIWQALMQMPQYTPCITIKC
jgi:hypothetical protein